MSLDRVKLLGHYELVALIGKGGMGEVYRARDTKLGREVAIKMLPEAFASDLDRMFRLEREAKLLASLNHPNVAAVHGVEDGAIVMELVEGQRLKGPLPIETALNYARQIAEALEAAHGKGIVHRDLKPDNIKITRDGTVKVLDFGLAKAAEENIDSYDPDNSPTVLTSQTQMGVLIGTAAYVSPEQARGEAVDKRTDIWGFGCILYEMLTGKPPFHRKTISDTLAAVLKEEPDWSRIPAQVQPLLRACLKKDPKQRLHDIADAKLLLENAPEATPARTARWRWIIAGAIGVLLGVLWSFLYRPASVGAPVMRWTATIPNKGDVQGVALSPDGSYLAYYVAERGVGHGQIYLRRMDELESRPIGGPDSVPRALFFSPDYRWIGYFAQDELKKAPVVGGSSITICNAPGLWGASWGPDDTIVFGGSPRVFGGLMRVSADGGAPQALTKPDPKKDEFYHDNPEFLPGGKAILFTIRTRSRATEIAALNLRTLQERVLVKDAYNPRYAPVGDLLFEQTESVFAVPFDPERLEVNGSAIGVIPHVGFSPTAPYAFSKGGTLVYFRAFATARKGMLVWVDRRGTAEPIPVPVQAYSNPSLSPDGENIAVDIGTESNNWDIWIYGIARHTLTRLASGGINLSPIWTPDGKRVTFSASGGAFRRGVIGIFSVPVDLSAPPEKIYDSRLAATSGSWLRDGSALIFYKGFPPRVDIWLLPGFTNGEPTGQRNPIPLVQTANPSFNDRPQLSPDGHWLAYSSNISGTHEIYVQPFPGPGGKSEISTDGGDSVRWARSGRELFYRNGDKMMAVEVQTEPVFRAGTPRVLFEAAYGHPPPTFQPGIGYDVAPDGKHFLMVKPVEEEPPSPQLQVVENWFEELKQRVPTSR